MITQTSSFIQLLDRISGRSNRSASDEGHNTLTSTAVLWSVAFAALWGLCAGSSDLSLALANLYKVPMVLSLSALSAIPAALLWSRLCGTELTLRELVLACVQALFAATLWLAALSPLSAVYLHTSSWAGPMLIVSSGALALLVGWRVLSRELSNAAGAERPRAAWSVVAVLAVLQLLMMLQLVSLVSPILGDATPTAGGIDGLWVR